jgi:iron complex outermembrane receptor protein
MNNYHLLLKAILLPIPLQAMAESPLELKPELVIAPVLKKTDKTDYLQKSSSSATKMQLPLRDTPQTVDIRNEQMIKDIGGLQRSEDVAKTVPGVNKLWDNNSSANYNFRGFSNTSSYFSADYLKDGYRKLSASQTTMDMVYIERLEFLKGPATILSGRTSNLGGTINFVSKRPLPNPTQRFDFTLGSYDSYRTTLDVGTSLNAKKSALLRFNAAIKDAASFRDFANLQTQSFAPAFSYDFDNGDQFSALIDYTNTTSLFDFGIPITPAYAQIPRSNFYQLPSFDHNHTTVLNTLFEYRHNLNDNWKLTTGISTSWSDWDTRYTRFFNFPALGPLTAIADPSTEHNRKNDMNAEAMIEGHVELANMDHHVLFGAGYITNESKSNNVRGANLPSVFVIDLLHPDHDHVVDLASAPVGYGKLNTVNATAFAQDLISLTPKVKLLLGLRYDHLHSNTEYQDFYGYSPSKPWTESQTDSGPVAGFSPRWGIIYQPTDSTSLYASYSTSFQQQINFLSTTGHFKPEIGQQYEIGLKQALSSRLNFNVSLFELTRKNLLYLDFSSYMRTSRQLREQQSKGIELSLIGNISDKLRLTAAYTWLRAEVTQDNVFKVNTERPGTPNHTFNMFGVYSFSGPLTGLEVGTGLSYNSRVQVSMPNTFKLPENIQWDALLGYRFNKNYKMQVNVRNITDKRNYSVTSDYGYISFGEPRTAYVTMSADF